MSLRVALKLETASPTKVVAVYDPGQNRFVVKQFHHIDPNLLAELRKSATAAKLRPEGIGVRKPASVDEAWELLRHYSRQSTDTQRLVDRAFTRVFDEIMLEPEGDLITKFNEMVNDKRVRFYIGNGSYAWLDRITKLSVFIDGQQHRPA